MVEAFELSVFHFIPASLENLLPNILKLVLEVVSDGDAGQHVSIMEILKVIKKSVKMIFIDQTFQLPERTNLLFEAIQIFTDMNEENLLWSWFLLFRQLLKSFKEVVVGQQFDKFFLFVGGGAELKKE